MGLCLFNQKCALLSGLTVMAVAVVAHSQTLMKPGQSIIFSAPDDTDSTIDSPSSPLQRQPADLTGVVRAPEINFNNLPSPNLPPPTQLATPKPTIPDSRANWSLSTPQEILGITTPEKILKITERDAMGQPKNPSAVERFYERQNQLLTNGAGATQLNAFSQNNSPSDSSSTLDANTFVPPKSIFGRPSASSGLFQYPQANSSQTQDPRNQNDFSSSLPKIFDSPQAQAQAAQQAASMEAFRKLLNPDPPSSSGGASSSGGIFNSKRNQQNPTAGQPFNSSGALPDQYSGYGNWNTADSQSTVPTASSIPDWRPQPAPWTTQQPQLGEMPRRKF